jgi:hypothetical protein
VLNQHYFSFFDVPDMIVKMAPNKQDYAQMIELLNMCKITYVKEKAEIIKKPIEVVKITDEDLIPLDLLRHILNQMKHDFQEKVDFINKYIHECQNMVTSKIDQLQVENAKIKKIIENNVFIAHLNSRMEINREHVFI